MQLNLDLLQIVQRQAPALIMVLIMAGYLANEVKQQRRHLPRQQNRARQQKVTN
jgi:hypothetical protein